MKALRLPQFSLHGRLTVAMAVMLWFIVASGLIGLYSVDRVVDALGRVQEATVDRSSSMEGLAAGSRSESAARSLRAIDRRMRTEIGRNLAEAQAARDAALLPLAAVILLGLGSVAGVSIVLARSIRRPLKELKRGVDEFAAGNLDHRVPIHRRDELGDVVDMFNHMAAAVARGQEDLARQAFHDPLTDLPNRDLFKDRVAQALSRQARDRKPLAVLFVDLDDFKTVNDSLGHAAGDELLMLVAARLRRSVRPSDTVARLGGDEFAVLVEEMRGQRDVTRVAERVIDALAEPIAIEDKEIFVHASVGITITYGGVEMDGLLRNADVAMYAAKRSGKGRYEIYDASMNEGVLERLELKADLQRALERKELVLHYQPLVGLETGEIVGAEALVRWVHPERGLIPPLDFIPLAEETGLIIPLGRWVMEEACRQAHEWQHQFGIDLRMSVNLSAKQFQEPALVSEVARALRDAPLAPDYLTLEITESLLIREARSTIQKLNELRTLGVHIAIDDFGTGYSSLNYLRQFPIETVKIDKSFTDGICQGPEKSALARAVLKLSQTLGMDTVAEGVGTADQVNALLELGCGVGQGSFFGKAMPPSEFEALLMEHQNQELIGFELPEHPLLGSLPVIPKTAPLEAGSTGQAGSSPGGPNGRGGGEGSEEPAAAAGHEEAAGWAPEAVPS